MSNIKSEFESREAFECIFGDEIDLSKDETDEYSFQPSRFAYSFFFVAWQHQQSKVDEITQLYAKELFNKKVVAKKASEKLAGLQLQNDELQKRVDAVKRLAQTLWEKSEDKHQQGKVWESKTLGECADEILDVLEQALKVGIK